ncbi:VCBS repeat-containing protein [Cnuella takakiae]|nr:VCBS repeat-containing protein [Cnuella takakiae]OLY92405.1 RNA-binding protein [Cnuella takakiae]
MLCRLISVLSLGTCSFLFSCSADSNKKEASGPSLFTLLPAEQTGIAFNDTLVEGVNTNVLMYEYFYNGGGVAAGDLNGDGLDDLYFSANMAANKLYLNKGNLKFEDITDASGLVTRDGPWKTGVAMADVNGDGRLDIYVSYSGNLRPEKLVGQLFINQGAGADGIPHFKDQTTAFGLDIPGHTTQAYFFDYDGDSDLDLLRLNHNPRNIPVLDEVNTAALLKVAEPLYGLRLYRNDGSRFSDVTAQTGLNSSALSYGLGAGISDFNNDGRPDIYVSNDYSAPDYLYINNGDGSFTDKKAQALGHISQFSMGNDVADINNDGLSDIITLDMLPADNRRQKLLFAPDNYEKFDLGVKSGFHYQYMRNMLQVANGDGTFSEVGQLAGISNTDWSWAPLFADYDNDGWKDLFVTNGYVRDFTNMDFMKYMGDRLENRESGVLRSDVLKLVEQMPASNVVNYFFRNNGNLTFSDVSAGWGMTEPSNSNGAAYTDLDNDGDLDLVVNNINKPAFVLRNDADKVAKAQFLKIKLQGSGANTMGVGAKLWLYAGGRSQYLEQMPTRGYQSSVSPVLHFGLGNTSAVDSLRIIWPGGSQQVMRSIKAGQTLTLKQSDAQGKTLPANSPKTLFTETSSPVPHQHGPVAVNDFKRQPLMVNPVSYSGPCMVKGDVNGDGLEDLFVGGGSGTAGALFLQQKGGVFRKMASSALEGDKTYEDGGAVFLDANKDGKIDLFVASGGYHNLLPEDPLLQDRLYLGDGKGGLAKAPAGAVPQLLVSKGCVAAADINGDGNADLFVGGRVVPGRYPETPKSFVLLGDGKGAFKDGTASVAPEIQNLGMVTDAVFTNLGGSNLPELVVVGEWMPVTVFALEGGKLRNKTNQYLPKAYSGWWNKILAEDLNGDGRTDLVLGNQGLNTQCKVSDKEPAELYFKDFDDNGAVDPILCFYMQGKSYPYVFRDELLEQMTIMRTRYQDYNAYADAKLSDIFTPEELKGAGHLQANTLHTTLLLQDGKGKFAEQPLPIAAQYAPVYALAAMDANGDGFKDLVLCGNNNRAKLRFGKSDANYGVLLKGNGKGGFAYLPQQESGLKLQGDVRSLVQVNGQLLFGINGQALKAYQLRK